MQDSRELLSLEVVVDDGLALVSVTGELDMSNEEELRLLLDRLHGDGHRIITLDVRDLEFIGSAGLGVFAHAIRNGDELRLRHVPPFLATVLHTCGLDGYVTVEPDDSVA
jgi:anti-sigma B factor antagonist